MYRSIFKFFLIFICITITTVSIFFIAVNTRNIEQYYYHSAVHKTFSPKDKSQRVAVIGGGVAGLTAAYRLKQKGYENVTVFEKNAEVGGKISTFYYQGEAYERGALGLNGFFEIAPIAKELGIEPDRTPTLRIYYQNKYISNKEYMRTVFGIGPTLESMISLILLRLKFPEIASVSLNDIDAELMLPLNLYLQEYPDLSVVVDAVKPLIVGQGYGYYEEVAAIYILRLAYQGLSQNFKAFVGLIPHDATRIYYFKNGYQKVLKKMADTTQVITSAKVIAIDRTSPESIKITYQKKEEVHTATFDKLIIATPLDSAREFVDDLNGEHALFQQIENYRYYTVIFRANNLPRKYGAFREDKLTIDTLGELLGWVNPNELDAYVGYTHAALNTSEAEMITKLSVGISEMEGDYIETLEINEWRYFPTVSIDNMQAGFFDKVDALQGRNQTYYIGSTLSIERVDFTIRQTDEVINRYF